MTPSIDDCILHVAGFYIRIGGCNGIAFEDGYIPFLSEKKSNKTDLDIEVIPHIPEDLKHDTDILFISSDKEKKLWQVSRLMDLTKITVFNPLKKDEIQQIAINNPKSTKWKIYCNSHNGISHPLAYPMGPILFYYLTVNNNALMLHASGIVKEGNGRMFSGFSGVGKSTMAGIWASKGGQIINDDRLILSIQNKEVMMYNTPMFYADKPKKARLDGIYLLKQSSEHCIRQLKSAEAVSRLMAFCIQHSYKKEYLENHLQTISQIYDRIPIYELGFKLDANVVDFIETNE